VKVVGLVVVSFSILFYFFLFALFSTFYNASSLLWFDVKYCSSHTCLFYLCVTFKTCSQDYCSLLEGSCYMIIKIVYRLFHEKKPFN